MQFYAIHLYFFQSFIVSYRTYLPDCFSQMSTKELLRSSTQAITCYYRSISVFLKLT